MPPDRVGLKHPAELMLPPLMHRFPIATCGGSRAAPSSASAHRLVNEQRLRWLRPRLRDRGSGTPHTGSPQGSDTVEDLPNDKISPLFQAVAEVTEETVYNAMLQATSTTVSDHRLEALPLNRLKEISRSVRHRYTDEVTVRQTVRTLAAHGDRYMDAEELAERRPCGAFQAACAGNATATDLPPYFISCRPALGYRRALH
jgi:hypothetical protein